MYGTICLPGEGIIKREDAVSLLKRVMVDCPSFCAAPAVSIAKDKERDSWELSVFWVPDSSDGDCLEKIVHERGLEVVTSNGHTVFRSVKKPVTT